MTALTGPRMTHERQGQMLRLAMAAATTIYQGAIVVVNAAGWAAAGSAALNLVAMGRAEETVVNAGANGAAMVEVRPGWFYLANDGANPVTRAQLGRDCYLVDDQTVAATDGGGTRSVAGKVIDVDANGVWVRLGPA